MPPTGLSLDTAKVRTHFIKAAEIAADRAAHKALERARKHAPVRKLFRGTSYRTSQHGFRVPRQRQSPLAEAGQSRVGLGHPNAELPVFRFRSPRGAVQVAGDFRRVRVTQERELGISGPRTGRLEPVTVVTRRPGRDPQVQPTPISGAALVDTRGRKLLTGRGRYEVRTGRAAHRAPGSEITRIGGRLKGEIHVQAATYDGKTVWAYVVSPTPYARHQEFGTVHNRPHPYLRPALHETRKEFVAAVKQSVRVGPQGNR